MVALFFFLYLLFFIRFFFPFKSIAFNFNNDSTDFFFFSFEISSSLLALPPLRVPFYILYFFYDVDR